MNPISKLGIGPMSGEIIEAVFRFSGEQSMPLMLIASKNQIDWDGGYVNNWNTNQYADYVTGLKKQYPDAKIYLCRDHCGPGFKNNDIGDVYKTIDDDVENGFDLIHIDFCHYKTGEAEILKESQKAIDYILKKKPEMMIEVGTEENSGNILRNESVIEEEMKFFANIAPVQFFVIQTGSLVKEINQVGKFNRPFVEKVKKIANKYHFKLKEHNADYLKGKEISERKGLIESVNIAPQFGVIQTQLTLKKAEEYGIDAFAFLDAAYKSGKWKKWLYTNTLDNRPLCSVIAGHYVFASNAYKDLYDKISKRENFKESIIREIMKVFKVYLDNL